jgi:N-acetylneuraminic acid mutarotase
VLPSFRLSIKGGWPTATGQQKWQQAAHFPGLGLDAPNSAVAGGSLYVLGGWRGSLHGMAAWSKLHALGLPVPITLGTNGGQLVRQCWKYTPATDRWERLPDAPHHIEQGGTAVLGERYIL